MRETLPYGSWASPIRAQGIAAGTLRLSQPRLHRGLVYWLEGRPSEGGRQVVVRARGPGAAEDVTPSDVNVRNRVHEYGGGDYTVAGGRIFYSSFGDGRVYGMDAEGGPRAPLTEGETRCADFELSPDGRWLVLVEERPQSEGESLNRLLAVPLAGGRARSFATGFDFVSFPRFSPGGDRLAFTAWCHPDMPWDATELHLVRWGLGGPGASRHVAGRGDESIFQPGFSPDGRLTFVSDRSGWWNLEQLRDGTRRPLCARQAEFGAPQWVFGLSSWAFVNADQLLCTYTREGRQRLARLSLASGALEDLPLPFEQFEGVRVEGRRACFIGAGPERPPAVVRLDLDTGESQVLREGFALDVDRAFVSVPEHIRFATSGGEEAHALLYRPAHADLEGPANELPPLLVKSHGGPTAATSAALDLRIQYWTSRGFVVLDVNYRGSTGYGRAYRDRLRGEWGVLDVDDCVAAAQEVVRLGIADGARLAISGGSAGGYTTLCALTFRDVFAAGASHYGIGDLEALVRDTHKFESRYCDRLVGPYPECADLYRARSPIHHTEGLSCPVIFFQGLEDRVVPPSQAETMLAALAARNIDHAYVPFEGEQHGFRRAENIAAALEGELAFYARVFGWEAP